MAFLAPLAIAGLAGGGAAAAGAGTVAALGIGGAAMSALGTIEQGQATSNAASYQAQVASNNAIISKQNAAYAAKAGEANAAATSLKGAAQQASLKAAIASNGIDVNSGSSVDVLASNRDANNLNTANVMNQALLQAYGYNSQATSYTAQSGLDTATAEQAQIGADIGAVGSLASNASSIGFKYGGGSSGSQIYNDFTGPVGPTAPGA